MKHFISRSFFQESIRPPDVLSWLYTIKCSCVWIGTVGMLFYFSLLGATGNAKGRKYPTSSHINCCNRIRTSFSCCSKRKSNGRLDTGSSAGLCNDSKKGCANASWTVRRLSGRISNILRITSNASNGASGNCNERWTGVLFGSFIINRFAFSDVTKPRSVSGNFPSLSVMIVS